jgi:hypothetical protein
MDSPFTFAAYDRLGAALVAGPNTPLTLEAYFKTRPESGFVILRYDVDDRPEHALSMARRLHAHGLAGTFYWHVFPAALFRVDLMQQVAALGHEIGYHFACMSRCRGDLDAAAALFRREVGQFRAAGFDVRTAAAHGAPDFDNKTLVPARPDLLDTGGLLGEAYADIDFGRVQYVSDAGWAWRRYPLQADAQAYRLAHGANALPMVTLETLIAEVSAPGGRLYLNTHPELWFENPLAARYYRQRRLIGQRVLGSPLAQRWVARLKGRTGL